MFNMFSQSTMPVSFTRNDIIKIFSHLNAIEDTLAHTHDCQVHLNIMISLHHIIATNLQALLSLPCFPQYTQDFLGLVAHEAQVRWFTKIFDQLCETSDQGEKQMRQMVVLSTMRDHYAALYCAIRRAKEFFHDYLGLGAGTIVTFNCSTQFSVTLLEDLDDEDEDTDDAKHSPPVVGHAAAPRADEDEDEEEDVEPTQQPIPQNHPPATVVRMRSGQALNTPSTSALEHSQDENGAEFNFDFDFDCFSTPQTITT